MSLFSRILLAAAACASCEAAQSTDRTQRLVETGARADHKNAIKESSQKHTLDEGLRKLGGRHRQTPEELGFSAGVAESGDYQTGVFSESYCLDLGAKGFPLKVFDMLQQSKWDPTTYFTSLAAKGYAEDALQMTGPQDAVLKTDCMKENIKGRTKHIFVGDSQMMSLRNAFHRRNGCPEIWWKNNTEGVQELLEAVKSGKRVKTTNGRFHSPTEQAPQHELPQGCKEDGIASFIYWDAWLDSEIPLQELQHEMSQIGVKPDDGDTVVVWVGSNFLSAGIRRGALLDTIDKLHALGVRMVWDSPTYHDEAIMAATSSHDAGVDPKTGIPITYTAIQRRKMKGDIGSNEYRTEKAFMAGGIEIPMTKRWQLTNRYRGLQCDGIHTDMRARDPLFYSVPCGKGTQPYGRSMFCNWVEPFKSEVFESCPVATGIDDMVLQSGLYALCAAHESPFCYAHTEYIR